MPPHQPSLSPRARAADAYSDCIGIVVPNDVPA
jgi:hypothetical protein